MDIDERAAMWRRIDEQGRDTVRLRERMSAAEARHEASERQISRLHEMILDGQRRNDEKLSSIDQRLQQLADTANTNTGQAQGKAWTIGTGIALLTLVAALGWFSGQQARAQTTLPPKPADEPPAYVTPPDRTEGGPGSGE